LDADHVGISLDETVEEKDLAAVCAAFGVNLAEAAGFPLPDGLLRADDILPQKVFRSYHSETEMLRYLKRLESKDLALNESMIALGSCTMKLNATSEMMPLSWPEVASLHPFVPADKARATARCFPRWKTGWRKSPDSPRFPCTERRIAGRIRRLLAIRRYHLSRGEAHRNICLIPVSAHGTNPASAVMAA
jgi:glycine dehydrogenase